MARMRSSGSQLLLPLSVLAILILVNLIKGAGYFSISIINGALYGNIPNILYGAAELVILSIGMTLVTSASGSQDLSVGVAATITSAVFVQVVLSAGAGVTWWTILAAFLVSCVVGIAIGSFNGALVATLNVQPIVATLIVYTAGRAIAFLIDGEVSPILTSKLTYEIGNSIPGVPIRTPIILTVIFIVLVAVLLKTTNLKLFFQAVGINQRAARLNGINPVRIKFLAFMIMGVCTAVAGFIAVTKQGRHDSYNLLSNIEMDAILAVAIGGNSLYGGKFSITGAIIGAYTIEVLDQTLLRLEVPTAALNAFKAVFIIILMVVSSPAIRELAGNGTKWVRASLGGAGQLQPAAEEDAAAVPKSDISAKREV